MYEKHFGLKSRPFRSNLEASAIFVGPAQVKVMANLKKALAAPDAVVSVTGVVGVGKTTIVNRALEAISSKRTVARVGRMQLAADEVLELLLTEFNVSRQPNGTIQRFAAFKRLLHDWAAGGTRAFIVVEDAERIGNDALIELEALTAADSGDSAGASIVLMGQPSLAERLSLPELARLKQRTRLRQTIAPLSGPEVQGYLKHCIRAAGGDFDSIFDPVAIDMLFRCSEGVPRVINNLCESVLAAAAEAGASLVMPQLVQHVANEEFGLQPTLPPASRTRSARKPDSPAEAVAARPAAPTTTRAEADARPAAPTPAKPEIKPQARSSPPAKADEKPQVPSSPPARAEAKPQVPSPPSAKAAVKPQPSTPPVVNKDAGVAPVVADAVITEFEPVPVVAFTPEPEPKRTVVIEPPVATTKVVAEAEKAVTAIPVPAIDATKQKPATAVQAEADELAVEDIPELIQDTQPELVALPAGIDLPDLTDLVVPAKGNGATKAVAKGKASGSLTLPTLDDIPTLSSDIRLDPGANATPGRLATPRPSVPAAETPKPEAKPAMPSKPAPAAPIQAKPASQPKVVVPPAQPLAESKADTTITEIPAWDRDPTLAELRPDIEALEAALAVVPEPAGKPEAKTDPKRPARPTATKPNGKTAVQNFDLPEITLEKELQVKEIEAQEALRKTSPPDTHEADLEVKVKRKHGFDLDRLAAELGKARSLEDVDDKLAETLFGEEMAQAAAEIAALVAADTDGKNQAAKEVTGASRPAAPAPAANRPEGMAPPAVTAAKPAARVAASSPATSHQHSAKSAGPKPGVPGSPAVGAAKVAVAAGNTAAPKGPAVEITLGSHPEHSPAAPAATPEPIENQFGTSMTATLKALGDAQMKQMDEDDNEDPDDSEPEDKEKPSRRLFGFFRGSS